MNNLNRFHWPLIIGMAAFALVSPLMSVTGTIARGRPFNPTFLNLVISLAWLAIVVLAKVRRPFMTLVFTGLIYAIFQILLSAVLSQALTGELAGPMTNPISFVGMLVMNALWAAFLGGIAWVLQRGTVRTESYE